MKQVIKASGNLENFNSEKIYNTIFESGASKELATETIKLVQNKYYKEITTKEILNLILENLKKEPGVSQRYNLKQAIMDLGPSGFPFEQYFARILDNYGYETKVDNFIKGKRIIHEVDIIAKKQGKSYMVECKYHNETGIQTRLHPAMYTYARFLDVKKFDIPWLATNTKCVDDAVEYAKGVNMKITSWNYPKTESLRLLIENKSLYPITSINSISSKTKEKLFSNNIILSIDLLKYTKKQIIKQTGLSEFEVNNIIKEIKEVCKLN
ncbi:MAG: ATP cone domain-containing protein [Candidatus ainarchaeum sp.]|nr:ATP cone domain-containing protein [Candidatus ainarchaeum sp.]